MVRVAEETLAEMPVTGTGRDETDPAQSIADPAKPTSKGVSRVGGLSDRER